MIVTGDKTAGAIQLRYRINSRPNDFRYSAFIVRRIKPPSFVAVGSNVQLAESHFTNAQFFFVACENETVYSVAPTDPIFFLMDV